MSDTHHSSLITHHPLHVELHCHTNYSMLDGASHPEEMVARARELGMEALAITDHDGLYGAVRFWQAAMQEGIRPIIGAEVTLEDESHLTLLARDREGYSNLCRLISSARIRTEGEGDEGAGLSPRPVRAATGGRALDPATTDRGPGADAQVCPTHRGGCGAPISHSIGGRGQRRREAPATRSTETRSPQSSVLSPQSWEKAGEVIAHRLAERSAGLICLSGCRQGEIARHLLAGQPEAGPPDSGDTCNLRRRGNFWIELQHHLLPEDDWLCDELAAWQTGWGWAAWPPTTSTTPAQESRRLQDILVCIKNRTTLDAPPALLRPNSEYYLKSAREMAAALPGYPGAVANSLVIARQCQVDLNFKGYRFPGFPVPGGGDPLQLPLQAVPRGGAGALPADHPRRLQAAGPRAGRDRQDRPGRVLPDRVGHHALRPGARHPRPGAGLGRRLHRGLRPGHHQGRSHPPQPPLRALPERGDDGDARHRHRLLHQPPGAGHPVRLREVRPGAHGHGVQRGHLPGPQRPAGGGQGDGAAPGAAGPLRQGDQPPLPLPPGGGASHMPLDGVSWRAGRPGPRRGWGDELRPDRAGSPGAAQNWPGSSSSTSATRSRASPAISASTWGAC